MQNEVSFELIRNIGILAEYPSGWKKEVNVVSWNSAEPKYDIRDWDPKHEHMSRGITLTKKEAQMLHIALTDDFCSFAEEEE